MVAIINNKKAKKLKNPKGLYSLNKVAIVFNTFNPSEYVFSFETLPSGLSR